MFAFIGQLQRGEPIALSVKEMALLSHHGNIDGVTPVDMKRRGLRGRGAKGLSPRGFKIDGIDEQQPAVVVQFALRNEVTDALAGLGCDPIVDAFCRGLRASPEINFLKGRIVVFLPKALKDSRKVQLV